MGYKADEVIGTNKHVFSVVGPHFGDYYGEVMVVLKQEIMYDPDFDMTPCAGTSFLSGNAEEYDGDDYQGDIHSWLRCGQFRNVTFKDKFHMAKLNAGVLGWRSVMAAAVATPVAHRLKKQLHEITSENIMEYFATTDSHAVIEGHLPEVVPLGIFAERVVIPRVLYEELTDAERARLEWLVGAERVVVIDTTASSHHILRHCFEELHEEPEAGFHIHLLPGVFRVLRGVAPASEGQAKIRLCSKGALQVMLGDMNASSSASGTLLIGFGKFPISADERPSEAIGAQGLVALSTAAEGYAQHLVHSVATDGTAGGSEPSNDEVLGVEVCWLLSSDGALYRTFELTKDSAGWRRCSIDVTSTHIQVKDMLSGSTVVRSTRHGATFTLQRVALKAGTSHAEVAEFKIM